MWHWGGDQEKTDVVQEATNKKLQINKGSSWAKLLKMKGFWGFFQRWWRNSAVRFWVSHKRKAAMSFTLSMFVSRYEAGRHSSNVFGPEWVQVCASCLLPCLTVLFYYIFLVMSRWLRSFHEAAEQRLGEHMQELKAQSWNVVCLAWWWGCVDLKRHFSQGCNSEDIRGGYARISSILFR